MTTTTNAIIHCSIRKECVDGEVFFLLQCEPNVSEEFSTVGDAIKWFKNKCYWGTQITYMALGTDTPEQIAEDLATHDGQWDQADDLVYIHDTVGENLTISSSVDNNSITALKYSNHLNGLIANQLSQTYQHYISTASAASVLNFKRILGMV